MQGSSVFDPHSPGASAISDFFWVVLIVASGVVLLISILVGYAGYKYRFKGNDENEPKQTANNMKLEIGWTVAPIVLLVVMFIPMLFVMGISDPSVSAQAQPDLVIVGHQWWWEYRYPKENVVTANELHIPEGQKLIANFESADVDHDFWVPQMGRKMDLIPGQLNQLQIQMNTTGVYHGACAEFCGAQHAWMLISVHVDSPGDYKTWLENQKRVPSPSTQASIAKGQQVFLNNTCINCHAIAGTKANAQIGPNLTHLGSRQSLGTGILDNNSENLFRWIKNVQTIKPGVHMPSFEQLTDSDLNNLVAYLESLK